MIMNLSESLEYAEDLFCDEKYEESSCEFDRLLNTAAGEERLVVAERCGRQCDFAAADFLIYLARAFLALRQNKSDEFRQLRSIALAYAENGIDTREFDVRWLKNLK